MYVVVVVLAWAMFPSPSTHWNSLLWFTYEVYVCVNVCVYINAFNYQYLFNGHVLSHHLKRPHVLRPPLHLCILLHSGLETLRFTNNSPKTRLTWVAWVAECVRVCDRTFHLSSAGSRSESPGSPPPLFQGVTVWNPFLQKYVLVN